MINDFRKRIRTILDIEQINREELKGLLNGVFYDLDGDRPIPADVTIRLFNHRRLQKYAMYTMTNQIAPRTGQISPDLAHCGQIATIC